jgi:Lon protease-like protein
MNPAALPLFPLHTVLFPGGLLPLQIFEVRYLDLMKRCEQSGEPFGVVCLQSGSEVRRAPRPGETEPPAQSFADVGTLASLEVVEHPQPGLMLVLARGGQRFKLAHAQALSHGLWVGEIDLLPDDAMVNLPPEFASMGPRLKQVMQATTNDEASPVPPPSDACWRDAGWVANRWAERLPLPAPERQRLMSLDNPLWRLELAAEWLEKVTLANEHGRQPDH